MALIRYPGSKERLTNQILVRFPKELHYQLDAMTGKVWEYREPFFGAGAIGLEALYAADHRTPVWLNDIDPGMVALWTSVRDHSDEFINRIRSYSPTPEEAAADFYKFQKNDGNHNLTTVERAFQKLVLHRTSFSGLGAMSSGPIGGKISSQAKAKYKADCRWNPKSIVKEIRILGGRLRRFANFKFTNLDFGDVIAGARVGCFIYVDPPYVEMGARLYKHSMDEAAHRRLALALQNTETSWVLSYDDHKLVHELYGEWANVVVSPLKYTMANRTSGERKSVNELIITPREGTACRESA